MYLGEVLFWKAHLSDYLQRQVAALGPFVERQMAGAPSHSDDGELIGRLLQEATVAPLVIDFDSVTKDAQSTKVRVWDYGRDVEIDGVRATRTYPYTGERSLFDLRPNTWSSVAPHGIVSKGTVTIGIEGRNDAASIKRELESSEKILGEYVDWQRNDVEQHNSGLRPKIERLVRQRRAHFDSIARLKEQL